ncbi:MAG: Extracellular nuclease [Acidobacteria bacterium]|nr:Extracellular nuclease [Acidobacteriota bacterium]
MKIPNRYLSFAVVLCAIFVCLPPGSKARQQTNRQTQEDARRLGNGPQPTADLGVTKSGSPDQVAPGSDITYQITVTNGSADPAENASLSDTLPPGLTFVSLSSPAGWNCMTPAVGAAGTVTCTNPSLAFTAGDVFLLVVNVPADAMPGTFFSNTATVSTTTFDPNDENNSSTASTLVMGSSADITVTKVAGAQQVPAGYPLTYTIQVSNGGPDNADNATLSDALPAAVTFVSLSQPAGWTCKTPAVGAGGTVSCFNPSFAAPGADTFSLVVSVGPNTPADTVITNTAMVSTTTPEPNDENNSDTVSVTVVARDPTAANGKISGRLVDDRGNPLAGVTVRIEGTKSRKTISDGNGNYHFDNVETDGFYTVTPARVNYTFNPFNRSFSLIGNNTEAGFTATFNSDVANPLDTAEYFVRQQYVDVLGREPDESGFNYWTNQILTCGGDSACSRERRVNVASAFFVEQEFRQSGAFIYNLYKDALGRRPLYAEYSPDRRQVVGGPGLEAQKQSFAAAFVARAEFASRFQNNITAESFVDALLANVQQVSGVDLSSRRDSFIARYNSGASQTESRAIVLREITESTATRDANYNAAFVLVAYFGYLQRNPDQRGYDFWLNVLNTGDPGNDRGMVCSFITSTEYQRRFSAIVSRSNAECGNQ